MFLPPHIAYCIQRLEQAGFPAYAVGGCVRDALLGLQPQDYDLCTAATPDVIRSLFPEHDQVLSGKKHGTIGIVFGKEVVEITTFRTEGQYLDNRHPDSVTFVDSIEADLSRRDFTVNAMAFSPTRGFADPFGGRQDLQQHRLRAVGDAATRFREDSLRILRGVRFAVRFSLTPEEQTLEAMQTLAPLMDNLARERVFDELCKLLPQIQSHQLLQFAPILTQVLPELASCLGFDQRSRHHAYDLYTHIAHVVEAVPPQLPLRWAALLHDVGKLQTLTLDEQGEAHYYGHAQASQAMAEEILLRLKSPTALRNQVSALIQHHMTKIPPEKKAVRRWLGRLGAETMEQLLLLQEADMGSKGTGQPQNTAQFHQIRELIAQLQAENAALTVKDLAVNGHDLMALGYTGQAIGQALAALLELVLDERLPNEKAALLAHLKHS